MYRAVILDVDGTLVDSNDAHAHAWVEALAERGRHVAFARIRPLIGMGGDKLLPAAAEIAPDSPEGQAITARRRTIFQTKYLSHVQPTRGARMLLEWLRDENLTLVVASSAESEELEALLQIADVTKLIEYAASSDDADRSKPDPDIVRAALARTGCPPSDAILIGDTPYDVEAAHRAGIGVIGVRCGGWSADALKGALAVYDDPADLVERYALSPFKQPLPLASQ